MQDDKTAKREINSNTKIFDELPGSTNISKHDIIPYQTKGKIFLWYKRLYFLLISPTLEEWKIISLPISLSFLYYILRLTRLLKKCLLVKKKTN